MKDPKDVWTVFLDRDGVINRLRSDYVLSWETFEFRPRATEAIQLLNQAGILVVVATNQRAVARGLLSEAELAHIHENMRSGLAVAGASLDAVYYCPHDNGMCACRKPKVGMFLHAQEDLPQIDFRRSVLVGDGITDMEAGAQLGCRLILITEPGSRNHKSESPAAIQAAGIALDGWAPTLFEAVTNYILPSTWHDGGI